MYNGYCYKAPAIRFEWWVFYVLLFLLLAHPPIKYSFNNYVHVIYILKMYGIFLPRYNFTLSEKMSKNMEIMYTNKKVTARRHAHFYSSSGPFQPK